MRARVLTALTALVASALALAAAAGCMGPSDTASKVHDLRILAISADPPDYVVPASWDPNSGKPAPIPFFRIRAQLGDSPSTRRTLNWRITTCSQPNALRCEGFGSDAGVGEYLLVGEGQGVAVDGLLEVHAELGNLDQLLKLQPLIEDALKNDPYFGFGGLPLVVSVHVWADGEDIFGGKRIPFWLPIPKAYEEIKANQMPQVPDVLFDGVLALPGDVVRIKGGRYPLDVFPPDPALFETYFVPTFKGELAELHESWTYAWYTTKGYFSAETTGGWDSIMKEPLETKTMLQLPVDTTPGPFQILCVVRDGRGGETWTVRDAEFLGQ
ncbi:MAG TPA: hypothetical protein VGK67_01515 [Myxococcales bacterium]